MVGKQYVCSTLNIIFIAKKPQLNFHHHEHALEKGLLLLLLLDVSVARSDR